MCFHFQIPSMPISQIDLLHTALYCISLTLEKTLNHKETALTILLDIEGTYAGFPLREENEWENLTLYSNLSENKIYF